MIPSRPPKQSVSPAMEQAFQEALVQHQTGRLQRAGELYRVVLEVHPNHPQANHNMGVLAVQMKVPAASLPYFVAALDADPVCRQYWLSYVDALFQAGQPEDAWQILALAREQGLQGDDVEALAARFTDTSNADDPTGNGNLPPDATRPRKSAGTIARHKGKSPSPKEINDLEALFRKGRYSEVESRAQMMTTRFPRHWVGWKMLGVVLKQMGRSAEALVPMQKAAALAPRDAEAHNNLGIVLQDLHRFDEAEASYRRALRINPGYAHAHGNLGSALQDLGRLKEAEASYRKALQFNPGYARAHNNLGSALQELGRLDEACASYLRGLQIKPDDAEAHYNLAGALKDLGRLGEAEASCRRALKIDPHYAEAHGNLGNILKDQRRLDEAEASYQRALQLKPDYAEAHYNRGHLLLATGRLAEGWREYEYRFQVASLKSLRPPTQLRQWTGQDPLRGDRLLVFKEQGMGDKLQFSRYLPLVASRFAGGVGMTVDRALSGLFRRSFPEVEILDAAADQAGWQWQCPLLSLPFALGTALETIPQEVPYLIADHERAMYWKSRLAALDLPASTRKIGVVWKPGRLMKNAALRALTLQQMAPLFGAPDCAWFSLQKEPDLEKAPWVASGKLIDWAEEFGDFDETAALLVNLDLVISVDTSVAHLSGGLGRPTWLFNRHASEWRWMFDREDSPWYPTMRLFTQTSPGHWDQVVERMADALGE